MCVRARGGSQPAGAAQCPPLGCRVHDGEGRWRAGNAHAHGVGAAGGWIACVRGRWGASAEMQGTGSGPAESQRQIEGSQMQVHTKERE